MRFSFLALCMCLAVFLTDNASAELIAHYQFDVDDGGTTPDAIGGNLATLGDRVAINTTGGTAKVGAGALEMLGGGVTPGPSDGAVTSNSFSWTSDARTVTLWWRTDDPNVNTIDGAFVSFGDISGNGTRVDIKE
ncbi:MAG: hypothetical protein GY869_32280, partial [Planctomycetes bacterium]|nr:hypothetical protein [Planctomycetota bacterium]